MEVVEEERQKSEVVRLSPVGYIEAHGVPNPFPIMKREGKPTSEALKDSGKFVLYIPMLGNFVSGDTVSEVEEFYEEYIYRWIKGNQEKAQESKLSRLKAGLGL
jgi:hypothetical protein